VSAHITVAVPARPELVAVVRAVVASVAARLDFSYDAIEDLRIVVDELCGQLLRTGTGGGRTLRLRIDSSPEGIELVGSTDAATRPWPPLHAERSLAWQVIEALSDRAAFEYDGEGPAVRVTKRLRPVGGPA